MNFAREFARFCMRSVAAAVFAAALSTTSVLAQDNSSTTAESQPSVGQLARHYRIYQRNMDVLEDLSFTTASDLDNANEMIMSYEPPELTRSWYAYNAIVAARAPGFMAMVRQRATAEGTDRFLAQAGQNPSYLWNLSSETGALNHVLDGIVNDTRDATAVGEVLNSRARTYMDRRFGTRLPAGAARNASEIRRAERNAAIAVEQNLVVPYRAQNVMQQVLEIAARISVDRSGNRTNAAGLIYTHEETNRCLRWAQLNLAQCLAAVRGPAEEAYCTGRHGVDDIAACWGWMVDSPAQIELSHAE